MNRCFIVIPVLKPELKRLQPLPAWSCLPAAWGVSLEPPDTPPQRLAAESFAGLKPPKPAPVAARNATS